MARLAASILAADFGHLAEQVRAVEAHADLIHVDVMDAHFVPVLSVGPVVVEGIRPVTGLPLHCHLMVDDPALLFDDLAAAGTEMVTVQVEAGEDPDPILRKARDRGLRTGLGVNPETPVEAVFPHLDELDDVIVMSVNPGWAGQSFLPEALPKVEAARAEIERRGLSTDVEVDGGINEETLPAVVEAGARRIVVVRAVTEAVGKAIGIHGEVEDEQSRGKAKDSASGE
jgi:ribulose-phosphate 3-epimerase